MMKYTQYLTHKVEVNGEKVEDYYTFKLEDVDLIYCGKVEKHWTTKAGLELFAIRDNECYIEIAEFSHGYLHGIGNTGYDYCFDVKNIPNLIKKLEEKYQHSFESPYSSLTE